jgi:hypothetical protein
MSDRLKDIPKLAPDAGNLQAVVEAIRQALQTFRGYRGDPLDTALTRRDFGSGELARLVASLGGGTIVISGGGGGGGSTTPDLTAPPTATGLAVTAGLSHIYVSCDTQTYTVGHGHGRTLVYGAKWPFTTSMPPTFSDAVALFDFEGAFAAYPSDPGTRWCIWIKWRSVDGVLSTAPAGGTNGVQATTGTDVSALLGVLTGKITASQLFIDLAAPISKIQIGLDAAAEDALSAALAAHNESLNRARALLAEASDRGTALSDVRTVIATGNAQLAQSILTLTARVDSDAGSFLAALQDERTARADAVSAEATARLLLAAELHDPSTGLSATRATLATDYTTTVGMNSAIASSAATLTAAYTGADAATLASANAFTYSRATIDGAISASASTLSAAFTAADAATLASANAFTYSRAAIDGAISASATTLTAAFGVGDAATLASAQAYTYSRATIDGAIASSASTLTASYTSAISAAVATEESARATADGLLQGQWTVKIDLNGYVSGFGLASTAGTATPFSSFIIRADNFAVASPSGPGITPIVPFIVNTTSTTENGVTIPPGVWMDGAYIRNLTAAIARLGNAWIDNAKIADMSADKITAGTLQVGAYIQSTGFVSGTSGWRLDRTTAEFPNTSIRGQLTASQIDTRGLTIKDSGGAVIFSAGTPLTSSYITPASGWLNSNISISAGGALSGAGGGSVTIGGLGYSGDLNATYGASWAANVTGRPANLAGLTGSEGILNASITINSAGVLSGAGGGTVTLSGMGAGAMALINQITSANVSTYIGSAAINLANINVASIGTLGALSSYLGTVEIAAGGYLRSGQTAWSTGSGFWLGWIGSGPGEPGFSIGGSAAYLRYKPSTGLELKLDVMSMSFSPTYISYTQTTTADTNYGSITATASGGNSPYTYQWSIANVEMNPTSINGLSRMRIVGISGTGGNTVSVSGNQPLDSEQTCNLNCIATDSQGRVVSDGTYVYSRYGTPP